MVTPNADADRFGIGAGRVRPPYIPRAVTCAHCGAGLKVKDESAQLVVCDYCGSRLDVSAVEAKALGAGPSDKPHFPLALGARFQWKGVKYEVIARMLFIEDNDPSEASRQYLLYHPRRGTLYLDEYQGAWSISWPTHVMPKTDAFAARRGQALATYDNRTWTLDGIGVYELRYVDGALPWIATVGDQIHYAEFCEKSGSGLQYEVERQGDEIEFGTGQALPAATVRRALGLPTEPIRGQAKGAPATRPDAAQMRRWYISLLIVSAAVAALGFLGWGVVRDWGHIVLQQRFSREELTGQALSRPFRMARAGQLIRVTVEAPALDNSWMSVDLAVVEGEDGVLYDFDSDVSYYHGYEGGESWSEGWRHDSHYIEIPQAGEYRVLVHAVGAAGETENAETAPHDLNVSVTAGALNGNYFLAVGIFAAFVFMVIAAAFNDWRKKTDG